MSLTAVCGSWVGAAAAPAGGSKLERVVVCNGGQTLVPLVGLVNRAPEVHLRAMQSARAHRQQRWRAPVAKLKADTVTESEFDEVVLKSSTPVLVDFWATWCGPCRLMGVVMDWAAQEYEGKLKCVKIETDPNPHLVDKYKVYGLPTLVMFVDGKEVPGSRKEGAMNKEKLKTYVSNVLPSLATTN